MADRSFNSPASSTSGSDDDDDNIRELSQSQPLLPRQPSSPTLTSRGRRNKVITRSSDVDLHGRIKGRSLTGFSVPDEFSSLLGEHSRGYNTAGHSPKTFLSRQGSTLENYDNIGGSSRHHSRSASAILRLGNLFTPSRQRSLLEHGGASATGLGIDQSLGSLSLHDRTWYDQFTSTDWVHDSIADAHRLKALRARRDFRGRLYAWFDGAQGWILAGIIGCLAALVAYIVDVTETVLFDYKEGYCSADWKATRRECCKMGELQSCEYWTTWPVAFGEKYVSEQWLEFGIYVLVMVTLACVACCLTLTTKTVIPSAVQIATLDENLGASTFSVKATGPDKVRHTASLSVPSVKYYPAAGSGVAEVKVILSGFVLHGYLGAYTLFIKTIALILSVASGLSLGKEGPYVHIATCIGNIACRLFPKYSRNDGKLREVLSASAACGVAVAFGAPLGGVLFSLEEVSYYFPPKTLFRTFFCSIVATLSLKFLNPYGTGKVVSFEVRYLRDWESAEMVIFVLLGVVSGAMGALFIKASKFWATSFRSIPIIKRWPLLEVFLVAVLTGLVSFWNRYTRLSVTELLYELASPCNADERQWSGLCPTMSETPQVIKYLLAAFVVKSLLTVITFGTKLPAGIYVPSMVVGGLLGRIVGHTVEYTVLKFPTVFEKCIIGDGTTCIVPGVYAMVAAGATMCGVTRLSVTLAVILFELTGSLNHVLPFSLAVLVSKWTADAIEPLSIYDLLTDMNNYPYLDNKVRPIFTSEIAELTPNRVREGRIIDVSKSALVPAKHLRRKLERLQQRGELDGGLPIVRDGVLAGLIPAPDLEFALDRLEDEEHALCLMSVRPAQRGAFDLNPPSTETLSHPIASPTAAAVSPGYERDPENNGIHGPQSTRMNKNEFDFTPYADPAPVSLDIHSPMDLVYECFVKLGLRYICVLKDGKFAGLVHKKRFVRYMKELDQKGEN
jgi:chloride channel 3/4/5